MEKEVTVPLLLNKDIIVQNNHLDAGLTENEKALIDKIADKTDSINNSKLVNDQDHNNSMLAYFDRGFDNTFMTLDQTGISNCNTSLLESLNDTVKVDLPNKKRRYSNESAIVLSSDDDDDDDEIKIINPTLRSILLPSTKKRKMTYKTPVKRRMFNTLLTASEYKKNRLQSRNLYNPNVSTIAEEDENDKKLNQPNKLRKTNKRLIVVDGSNVGYHHGLNKGLSVRGIEICIRYFEKMGHEVKVIVPQYRLQYGKSSDPRKLTELHEQGRLIFTPCKNLGNGRCATSYDDRYILQIAVELDGAVISNDNYRDLMSENIGFKKIIENRVIGFTWCHDLFILAQDPYGKNGPKLDSILRI